MVFGCGEGGHAGGSELEKMKCLTGEFAVAAPVGKPKDEEVTGFCFIVQSKYILTLAMNIY